MNLLSLRYFIEIEKCKSFTKASEHLFVTQPTLSRQILDLEEELGVQLFIRGRHSLSLTEPGNRLLHEAKEILKRCDNLRQIVRQSSEDMTGSLSIGYQAFLDTKLMYSTIKSLTSKNPYIDFSLVRGSSSEVVHCLMLDKCDVVFTVLTCVESIPNVECIKLEENKLQIATSRSHPLANRNSVDMKELMNEQFIMLDRKNSPLTVDYSISQCTQSGFSPKVSYYVDEIETALLLVGSGKGITFLFSKMSVNNADIKILNIDGLGDDLDFVLAYKKNNTNPIIPILVSEIMDSNNLLTH